MKIDFDMSTCYHQGMFKERNVPFLKPTVLSFRGPIGSGKTTACNFITDRYSDVVKLSFATALKVEIYDRWMENWDDEFEAMWSKTMEGHNLALPIVDTPELKVAAINSQKEFLRPLLQYYGTEYRRAQDPDYWVNKLYVEARGYLNNGKHIVIDDARFSNERETIHSLGGYDVFILNPYDTGLNRGIIGHASEALNNPTDSDIDYLLANIRPIAKFERVLETFIGQVVTDQWRDNESDAEYKRRGGAL